MPGSATAGLRQVWLDDSDELAPLVGPLGVELTRLGPASGKVWFASGLISALGLQAVAATGCHHVRGGVPRGVITLQFDLGSEGTRRLGGQPLGGDDVALAWDGAQFDLVTAQRHKGMNLSLPVKLVEEALEHREILMEPLRKSATHVMTDCGPWADAVRRLATSALEPGLQPPVPALQHHMRADIGDALLDLLRLPFSRRQTARLRPVYYQRMPIVRRAIEFMQANLGEPLMLHDLCAAVRVSERLLDYAFHDVCGTSPKQYLRSLRLKQVRRALTALPRESASVTEIAHQYGFWHMGHFSAAYRRLFGETPRQTRTGR